MIYVIKKDGLIYITTTPRNKESDEKNRTYTELLYTFPDQDIEKLYKILRPWKALYKRNPEWFKVSCLGYIKSHKDNLDLKNEENMPIQIKDKEQTFKLCLNGLDIFSKLEENQVDVQKFINLDKRNILYSCDIYNIFEDIYNSRIAFFVESYINLRKEEKEFIQDLSNQPTREKRLGFLENNIGLVSDIYELLPSYLKIQISCLGINKNSKTLPMFKNSNIIGGELEDNPEKFIQEEIYNTFHIGEHWLGKDIKEELERIYKKYNWCLEEAVRIQDLGKYFEISYFSFEGTGQYRLIKKLL